MQEYFQHTEDRGFSGVRKGLEGPAAHRDAVTHVGIRAHDILPAAAGENVPNRIRVLPVEQVSSPFEWTLIFQNREDPGAGIWMKSDRSQNQIPGEVTVDPSKILLLEE